MALHFCFVYKSAQKENSYLYCAKENDFSALPKEIAHYFGKPIFVMKLPLIKGKIYPAGSAEDIQARLEKDGFLMQLLNEQDFDLNANSALSID